jgi:predicted XRE-type DNA-binding protein
MADKVLQWLGSSCRDARGFPREARRLVGFQLRRAQQGSSIMKLKVTPSTGNVFRDLGFRREEAEHLLVRADLLIQVQKLITSRRLKQREAAKLLHVSQPRVSDLLRGRIDLFSTDALIDMLARLGARVRLTVKPARGSLKVA